MYSKFALLLAGTIFLHAQSAVRDAELLARPLSLNDLTEETATQLEDAAKRQVDRAAAAVEKVRKLVDAGVEPKNSLDAPLAEQAFAQETYDRTLARTALIHQVSEMAALEEQALEASAQADAELTSVAAAAVPTPAPIMERFDGNGSFTPADLHRVETAFEQQFHKALPVSADGETAVHRAMGFDHRNRVDVALYPDTSEGMWLRRFLEAAKIPYYAFRSFVAGKATAAHIHIGPPSLRIIPFRG